MKPNMIMVKRWRCCWCQAPIHRCLLSSESGAESIVDSLLKLPCELSTHYLQMLRPTISLPPIWSRPTVALYVSGGGQCLATIAPFWHQRTSWWVCPITHETTEYLYNYLPLVFINCYGDSTPVERTTVDVRDIATPGTHDALWC